MHAVKIKAKQERKREKQLHCLDVEDDRELACKDTVNLYSFLAFKGDCDTREIEAVLDF